MGGGVVTVCRSAMAVFKHGGQHEALMLGRTTDLRRDFPSSDPGVSRGP